MKKLVTLAIASMAKSHNNGKSNAKCGTAKNILMSAIAAFGVAFGVNAACPEGYTDLGGTYSFKVNDEHANSGKWYINGEFQPVDGATIDGADWYVDSLIAFQGNGKILNLKSGSIIWTATNHGGGVWPENNDKWLNFVPGSTFRCSNPNIPMTGDTGVFKKCFQDQWSNFRYNNDKITDEKIGRASCRERV